MQPQDITKGIQNNVNTLMTQPVGQARQRAIKTLAKRKNISISDAKFHQAIRIAQSYARKQK